MLSRWAHRIRRSWPRWAFVAALILVVLIEAPWQVLTAFAVGGVVLALDWRQQVSRGGLFGPLFYYDLMRLARRGRSVLVRTLFALALFSLLCLVYSSRFPQHDLLRAPFTSEGTGSLRDMAEFSLLFVMTILSLQGVAILILSPAYLAPAIAEEKERRTLEMLFTTDLFDREIVIGKLAGRLIHLLGIILTSLPLMFLSLLWGGVDVAVVIAGVVSTAMSLLSVGSLSILMSVLCRSVFTAVVSTYMVMLFFSFGCLCSPIYPLSSPLAFLFGVWETVHADPDAATWFSPAPNIFAVPPVAPPTLLERLVPLMSAYVLFHLLITLFCLWQAIRCLRMFMPANASRAPENPVQVMMALMETSDVLTQPAPPPLSPLLEAPVDIPSPPPPGERPLLWKEMYFPRRGAFLDVLRDLAAPAIGIVGFLMLMIWAMFVVSNMAQLEGMYDLATRGVNWGLRGLTIGLAVFGFLLLGFRAAVGITREREQQTLESLFMLPIARWQVLEAKWVGSIYRQWPLGLALVIVWALGLVTGALNPLSILLLFLTVTTYILLIASLGTWLSLVCRNSLWSNFSMALMLLLLFTGSVIGVVYANLLLRVGLDPESWVGLLVEVGLSPIRTLWYVGQSWSELGQHLREKPLLLQKTLSAILTGLTAYAVLAWLLWLEAGRQFRGKGAAERKTGEGGSESTRSA